MGACCCREDYEDIEEQRAMTRYVAGHMCGRCTASWG
jgi:hypothetical protein|eukprot:COSAG01_NODE_4137_length_5306_cov_35.681390_7_plen_37_part_00